MIEEEKRQYALGVGTAAVMVWPVEVLHDMVGTTPSPAAPKLDLTDAGQPSSASSAGTVG